MDKTELEFTELTIFVVYALLTGIFYWKKNNDVICVRIAFNANMMRNCVRVVSTSNVVYCHVRLCA